MSTPFWALRITATLTTVVLIAQFVTAGGLLTGENSVEDLHAAGAIALHVLAGLQTVAAALVWRSGGPWWPAALSVAAFALSFVQASVGETSGLAVHVPLASLLVILTVWVLAWSWSRRPG
ncbi:hypothetical protein CFN78_09795 [Amycolatopsis antarctica]|uniref:Integral membrane protein n=1 Tax=Amycolatopsis antarctica TaxID=1854586 RepID=A0A263D3X5_9PSEU|nr:hypothetical protein CFN78_09795 [Amycolatopsis antarctica]